MSGSRSLLVEMSERLFSELERLDLQAAWPRLEEAGFATLLIPEEQGGFGGDWGDAYAVLRLAGQHAIAAPLGEAMVARRLLADSGIPAPDGMLSFAAEDARVPWGRSAAAVLAISGGVLQLYLAEVCSFNEGESLAGEPRDRVRFTGQPIATASTSADLMELGAFCRVAAAAGAIAATFQLAIEYANSRIQFKRPLSKFQAVQHTLALYAEEGAAIEAAGQAAAAALDAADAGFEIAAAKLRANRAIGVTVPIAHQVHGAMGFTMEYPLNRYTRRLLGWRSEFGSDAFWAERLGTEAVKRGGANLWRDLVSRTDRQLSQKATAAPAE